MTEKQVIMTFGNETRGNWRYRGEGEISDFVPKISRVENLDILIQVSSLMAANLRDLKDGRTLMGCGETVEFLGFLRFLIHKMGKDLEWGREF